MKIYSKRSPTLLMYRTKQIPLMEESTIVAFMDHDR